MPRLVIHYQHHPETAERLFHVSADGTPNLTYTPDAAFTSWTAYTWPSGLSLGGGARYTGGLHRGTDGAVGTPVETKSYTVYDALLSYRLSDSISLRLNLLTQLIMSILIIGERRNLLTDLVQLLANFR